MKNMMKSAIMLGLVLLFAGTTQKASAQNEDVSLQSFYDELSPYGTWIQDPQYGYVWRPDVDQDEFRPYYTNGRWVMTEYGNTWVSNYDWGWAPFHYGRWVYNSYNNWIWIPDTVWGPAWVSWRSGGGYYGWAPLGPSISIGINIGRGGYRVPDMCWNFIPYNNIYINNYPRYNYGRNRVYIQNTVIINNTYVRNNRTYYTGPRIDDIRRTTNQRVNVYAVNRSHSPGVSRVENNRVTIYQPRASRDSRNSTPAPRNAVQGNISRGPVGRDYNSTANRGNDRNDNRYDGNRGENRSNDNRWGNRGQRTEGVNPTRESNGRVTTTPESNDNRRADRSGTFGRTRENNGFDRGNNNNPSQQQRVDRSREMQQQPQQQQAQQDRSREIQQQQQAQQQRMERSREMQQQQQAQQQRMERSREMQQQQQQAQQQRMERSREMQQQQQQAQQQRMERPAQQSAPRAERVERPQPQQQQRGGGNEGRGESRGGGRPGRG